MEELSLLQRVAVWVLPVLFAITIHETAHGWMALRLGDPTARMLGRLTLNPIKHIDPLGTILVPGLLLMFSGFLFGWAKPVPITAQNLRRPKTDMAWVAVAGPLSNLLMAIFWALVARLGLAIGSGSPELALFLIYSGMAGMFVNILLMVLNLLPLPPLDGGRVVSALLPGPMSWRYDKLEPYGFFILLGLLMTGILGKILWPAITLALVGLAPLAGLNEENMSFLLTSLLN
ncbi:MAG: site-2 protease family protein [Chromatiales bacterium]|nr:site-2 protease family protein [Gammaproteobacteria bacterium]MBW6477111.1 site-2 protease family protein [Chromatiales bacterium]